VIESIEFQFTTHSNVHDGTTEKWLHGMEPESKREEEKDIVD